MPDPTTATRRIDGPQPARPVVRAAADIGEGLIKTAVRRPRANEGGREEEEKRPKIPVVVTTEPHSRETGLSSL
jgi:hypothetical protein